MKILFAPLLLVLPLVVSDHKPDNEMTSLIEKGSKAPNTHHLGEAWLNFLVQAEGDFNYNITQATFTANSTLDWHKHATPQVLLIIEGEGYYQERGKAPIILKKGDVIKCGKNVEHWHSATAEQDVSYIAIYGSEPTVWTEKLSREYYDGVARQLKK